MFYPCNSFLNSFSISCYYLLLDWFRCSSAKWITAAWKHWSSHVTHKSISTENPSSEKVIIEHLKGISITKELSENIISVSKWKIGMECIKIESIGEISTWFIESECVVISSFIRIWKNRISFRNFLKLLLCFFFVIWIFVWMPFKG